MSFGENLQFLRKMHNNMSQEELSEILNVSRQTISKWELDSTYPEMSKVIELCKFFSCSMDQLILGDLNLSNNAYLNIRCEEVAAFSYFKYEVISKNPENDAVNIVNTLATTYKIENPNIIGWNFPFLTQEQINVYHMHGYTAACILPEKLKLKDENLEIISQNKNKYAVITIKNPFTAPFNLIPNAYKALMSYMKVNKLKHRDDNKVLPCFEKEYLLNGITYMDVYIAIDI